MSNQKNKQVAMAAAIAMMLMVIACCTIVIAFNVVGPSVVDGDGNVVVIDDGGDAVVDGVDLKQCRLLPIYHKVDHIDEDLLLIDVVNDKYWNEVEGELLDMQHLSDSSQELYKSLVSEFNLTPPCVILVQTTDDLDELVWSIPLNKDTIANVKERLK